MKLKPMADNVLLKAQEAQETTASGSLLATSNKDKPALYSLERSWDGFEWLVADDYNNNVYAYERSSADGQRIIAVINFSGVDQTNYRIGVHKGRYKVVFDSDAVSFGGKGTFSKKTYSPKSVPSHGKRQSISVNVARLSFVYLLKVE